MTDVRNHAVRVALDAQDLVSALNRGDRVAAVDLAGRIVDYGALVLAELEPEPADAAVNGQGVAADPPA